MVLFPWIARATLERHYIPWPDPRTIAKPCSVCAAEDRRTLYAARVVVPHHGPRIAVTAKHATCEAFFTRFVMRVMPQKTGRTRPIPVIWALSGRATEA